MLKAEKREFSDFIDYKIFTSAKKLSLFKFWLKEIARLLYLLIAKYWNEVFDLRAFWKQKQNYFSTILDVFRVFGKIPVTYLLVTQVAQKDEKIEYPVEEQQRQIKIMKK